MAQALKQPKHGFGSMQPRLGVCADCGMSTGVVELINGQEKDLLCSVCLKEAVIDMVLNNDDFAIQMRDDFTLVIE